jgi:hypothetical protein
MIQKRPIGEARARPKGFVRDCQLGLALAVELGWLSAWSAALGYWLDPARAEPLVGLPLALLLALLAAGATRVLPRRALVGRWERLGLAALGFAAALAVAGAQLWSASGYASLDDVASAFGGSALGPRVIGAFGLAVAIWWRASSAGQSQESLDDVESRLRLAVGALAFLFVVNALAGSDHAAPSGPMIAATLVVVGAGLVGLPLARLVHLDRGAVGRDVAASGINRQWLVMLLATVALLLAFAIVLALVLTFQRIDKLTRLVGGPLDTLLGWIVYAIALPLGYLVEGIVDLARLLLHPHQPAQPLQLALPRPLAQLGSQPNQGAGLPPIFSLALKLILIGGVAAAGLALLARAVFGNAGRAESDGVVEERDIVWSWAELRAALRGWLRWILGQRPRLMNALIHARALSTTPPRSEPRDPREIYRALLRVGSRLGRQRSPSETPREYARRLATHPGLASGSGQIRTVTDVYVQARYGPVLPDATKVEAARGAVSQIEAIAEASTVSAPPDGNGESGLANGRSH